MKLPSIKECEENYNNMLRLWEEDCSFKIPDKRTLRKAEELCENLPLFHVSWYPASESLLNEGQITPFKQRKNTENTSMIGILDKKLGLDKYMYFTYGKPFHGNGPIGLTFCFSIDYFLNHFIYPDVFFTWGDIVSFIKNGKEMPTSISDIKLEEYCKTILPLEWLVKVCSYFLSGFYPDCFLDGVIYDWHKSRIPFSTSLIGPEIKCASSVPINNSSLIITDEYYFKKLNEQESLYNISADKILFMPYEKMNQFSKDTLETIVKSLL